MAKHSDAPESVPASTDAYTGMLTIALLALIAGCVLLYLDYQQYPEKTPTPPKYSEPAVPAAGAPIAAPPPKAAAPPPEDKKDEAK